MGKNKRKSQSNEVQTPKKQKKEQNSDSNKKNTPKGDKLQKFSGTANLHEIKDAVKSSEEESDYEVETEVKPEKITKTMNEVNSDSDETPENDDSEDNNDENDSDSDSEETDNVVNENSENDGKKQKKTNKDNEEKIKQFIEKEGPKGKMRYVLFIGNLPYTCEVDDVKNHFKNGIDIKNVRLPKGDNKKPRGFGYLEVADKDSYLKAMSMHHSFLLGRRINVQYTAGGNKNSAKTKSEIKSKNLKLNALWKDGIFDGKKHSNKRSVRRAKKRAFEKKTE